jgi:hypothetical protein
MELTKHLIILVCEILLMARFIYPTIKTLTILMDKRQ